MNHEPRRIIDFLKAPARPEGDASRGNPRRPSSARVELAWPEGPSWRTIRGRLRDISRLGAGLVARSAPPATDRARLRLVDGEGTPWIEVEVLASEAIKPGRFRVRLRLLDPCPAFLLQLAILGPNEPEAEANPDVVTEPATPYRWVVPASGIVD